MESKETIQKMKIELHIDADKALETINKVRTELEQIISLQNEVKKMGAGS